MVDILWQFFLLSNHKLEVLSFDICQHNYVKDIANYYKNKYNFNFVEGGFFNYG